MQLNHPKRLLDLFTSVVNGPHQAGSYTGRKEVDTVLAELSDAQLWNLLKRLRDWNANARTYNVAQHVLNAILRLHPKERILGLRRRRRTGNVQDAELADAMAELSTEPGIKDRESVKDVLDGLKAYTERHYTRLEKTSEERFVLLWALHQMDEVGGGDEVLVNGHGQALLNGHHDEMDVMT